MTTAWNNKAQPTTMDNHHLLHQEQQATDNTRTIEILELHLLEILGTHRALHLQADLVVRLAHGNGS